MNCKKCTILIETICADKIQIPLRNYKQILMNEQQLSENAVIYLSAGFQGPYILQAFTVRKMQPPNTGLQMCLTDGKVYIGAKFNSPQYPELQDYWLVEVTAKFISQTMPIIIKTMQVVSTYPRKLLGSPPCNLLDHFNKQVGKAAEQKLGEPTKKIKYSNSYGLPLLKNSDTRKPQEKQKNQHSSQPSGRNLNSKKQFSKPKLEFEKKPVVEKKLKLADSEDDDQQKVFSIKKQQPNSSLKKPAQQHVQIDIDSQTILKNSLISDLYERRSGWVILCRINYLNRVKCASGLYANNFMLTDQEGDEIKCVYFENPLDDQREKLDVDIYYSFSEGQITRGNKNQGGKQLQITFDKNSNIIRRNSIDFQLNLSKITRINAVSSKDPGEQLNVIGIIKNTKLMEQKSKSKVKFNATICDPLTGYEIDLVLFLHYIQQPPIVGSIGVLHNYQLYRQNNIYRLNSNYRSYFREEKSYNDLLTQEMKKFRDSRKWQHFSYKNLSSVAFAMRTIEQLKDIYQNTDDDKIYSLIDGWPIDISCKKFYNACRYCKKVTQKREGGSSFCANCQKQVETIFCHTLTVNFADYRSSFIVDVIGEHAQTLLEMKSLDFNQLSPEKQLEHLDSLRYKNILLKIKTEKKGQKKYMHSVWAIQNSEPSNSVREVKRRLQCRKIKVNQTW